MSSKALKFTLIHSILFLSMSSCGIYTSSDRKKFETDNPTPPSATSSFKIQSDDSCSEKSLGDISEYSEMIYESENDPSQQSFLIRRHIVNGVEIYESDNLKGVFCVLQHVPTT